MEQTLSDRLARRGYSLSVSRKVPIVIGYIVQGTGSFAGALVFVGANAALAIVSYLVVVGEIKRVTLGRSIVASAQVVPA